MYLSTNKHKQKKIFQRPSSTALTTNSSTSSTATTTTSTSNGSRTSSNAAAATAATTQISAPLRPPDVTSHYGVPEKRSIQSARLSTDGGDLSTLDIAEYIPAASHANAATVDRFFEFLYGFPYKLFVRDFCFLACFRGSY